MTRATPAAGKGKFIVIVSLALTCFQAKAQDVQARDFAPPHHDLAGRTYDAACAACHYRGAGKDPYDSRSPLETDTSDDLVNIILFGKTPEIGEAGMPAFGPGFTDADIARLAAWLRTTARPDAPWPDIAETVARLRISGRRED
jgi:mono/diheme cytochrome c family protein